MKSIFTKIIFTLAIVAITASCKSKEEPEVMKPAGPLSGLIKLKEGYAYGAGTKVQIWGKKNFFMGYNQLTVLLLDSVNEKDTIKDAHIHFMPVMVMGGGMMMPMQHACPVENPDELAPNGIFSGAIAFVMSTSTAGYWTLGLTVHNHKTDKYGAAGFNITVDNPSSPVLSVFTSLAVDAPKLVLSLVSPTAPKVGMNDIEFTLHRKESDMSWPADTTHTFIITPEMPSMGHGSPNNVNPVHIGNGHYKGKVNFTMTGEWKINVEVQKDGKTISKDANFIVNL